MSSFRIGRLDVRVTGARAVLAVVPMETITSSASFR